VYALGIMGHPIVHVVTLNCWNVSEPYDERMALIRADLAALRPDVIALQEIVVRRDGFDQAAMILGDLGYAWVFGPAFRWDEDDPLLPPDSGRGDAFGNVVASRWPIRASTLRALPGTETNERRSVLAARIETPGGMLPVLTTHLNWRFDQGVVRERQVAAVATLAAEWRRETDLAPILMGDFNAEPESTEIRFLCGLASLGGRSVYFQDAWRIAGDGAGFTWDNRNRFAALEHEPNRRIDYVLVGLPNARSGQGGIESAQLAFTKPRGDVFPSDHFGLAVAIRG
jgi:endonuclease/exonuclease/phosphatase family metal-dependent hydrolase